MNKVKHLALFFRKQRHFPLYWVRAPLARGEATRDGIEQVVKLVLACNPELEFVHCGETEYTVDGQYFETEGASKRLLYLDNCHLAAAAEAFGGAKDEFDDDFVRQNTQRIGTVHYGVFKPCEPEVVERVAVSPTTIPDRL